MHWLDGTNKGERFHGNDPSPRLVDPRRLHGRRWIAGGTARPRPHPRGARRAEALRLVRRPRDPRHLPFLSPAPVPGPGAPPPPPRASPLLPPPPPPPPPPLAPSPPPLHRR